MNKKIKTILIATICVVILCTMALSVSAYTHAKYQDTTYHKPDEATPKINIKSSVQANFLDNKYFAQAYAAIRYDEYNTNENLTGNNNYGNLYVTVHVGKYTPTDYTYPYESDEKQLIINDPEEDYVGVRCNFDDDDKVSKIRCRYTANLMSEYGTKVNVPDIVATYSTMKKR